MSYGDKRQHERISQHERMSRLGNAGASTNVNPGDGSSATLSDPTQTGERVHVRSYVSQIEQLIERERKPASNWSQRLLDSSAKTQTSQPVREPSHSTSTSWRSTPLEKTFMIRENGRKEQNQQESINCHTMQLLEDKDVMMEGPAEDTHRLPQSLMGRETGSEENLSNQTCLDRKSVV